MTVLGHLCLLCSASALLAGAHVQVRVRPEPQRTMECRPAAAHMLGSFGQLAPAVTCPPTGEHRAAVVSPRTRQHTIQR